MSAECLFQVPLSHFTTIGCGGNAAKLYFPQTESEFALLVQEETGPYFILGNGSNVLPADEDFQGSVFCTKKLKGLSRFGNCVYAACGVFVSELLEFCAAEGLSGLEFLVGIPATIGGLLYMNGGIGQLSVGNRVKTVDVILNGERRILTRQDCVFGYRTSRFQREPSIILGATFLLQPALPEEIRERTEFYAARRKNLPKGRSMGCVFRNPSGHSAGLLIQMCGLNGLKEGGAEIAKTHGNFILNTNHATSREIQTLIEWMKASVLAEFSIPLEEEIVYLRNHD